MPDYIPFGWFYLLNLLIGSIFMIAYGIRKKYSPAGWLSAVALLMILFIAGIKLMGFPVRDWPGLLTSSSGDPVYAKFVPGGVLFFVIGWMLIKWFLKFRPSLMDSMVLVIPWMIVVQRIGCYINGCCYGKPSDLPWAVSYPAGTSAFEHYAGTGRIHEGELVSCGLHPAQLYMVLGALIAWFIIRQTRRIWKSGGSRALFGMLLLGMMRFVVEFFRETPATKWYSQSFLGMNALQWIILLLVLIFTVILIRKERTAGQARVEIPLAENLPRTSGVLILAILLVWNLRRLLEFQELVLIQGLATAAIAFTIYDLFHAVALSRSRLGFILILLIAFTTMSQDLVKTESDSIRKDPVKTWFSLSVAGSEGRYVNRIRDCSGNVTSRELMNQASGGIGLNYHYQPNTRNQMDFGARGWISDINNLTIKQDSGNFSYGINPYFNYNSRSIGLGIGVNAYSDFYWPYSAVFRPSLYLRLGPEDKFFIDAGFQDQMMLNGHLSDFHIGLGSGFKTNGKVVWRTGLSMNGVDFLDLDDAANFYLMGDFRIHDRFYFKPAIYLGNKAFGMLSLSYNFGYRDKIRE